MISKERLMAVLLAPHVSEKAAIVTEKANQVVFRVRKDATKPDIKAAVELMFEVQVDSVQVVNSAGKHKRFGGRRPPVGLQEGLRDAGRGQRSISRASASKPARSGYRKDGSDQDQTDVAGPAFRRQGRSLAPAQGRPVASLTSSQKRSGARNNQGRLTTRHKGGGHAALPRGRFPRTKDGVPARSSGSSTTRTAPRTWRWCCMPTASVATSSRRKAWRRETRSPRAPTRRSSRATRLRSATSRSAPRSTTWR